MKDGKLWSTPKEVYPFIAKFVKGKVFCDLGSGRGHILDAMDGIAKSVIGVECNKDVNKFNHEFMDSKEKFKVLVQDFTEELPEAEVYYMWVGDPKRRHNAIKDKLIGKILLVGAHHGTRETKFINEYADSVMTTMCKEGNGRFSVGVFYNAN